MCRGGNILGLAMACANTFGLVTGAFLLGYGLSEIPKGIWRNANWTNRHKTLSHNVYRIAVKLDDAHQEFSNAIVVSSLPTRILSTRNQTFFNNYITYSTLIENMHFRFLDYKANLTVGYNIKTLKK